MRAVVFLCLLGATAVYAGKYNWNVVGLPQNPLVPACSSNYASCGCCLMEKQMERMMEFFNHSHEHLSYELKQSKNVINTIKAAKTVFSASLTKQSLCLGPLTVPTNIVYGTVAINHGNNYDASTGVYTAPVTGVYSLSVTMYSNANRQAQMKACADLMVNGNVVNQLHDKSSGDRQDSSSVVITTTLQAGDKVSVNLPTGCAICGVSHNYNTFTGFLLYLMN